MRHSIAVKFIALCLAALSLLALLGSAAGIVGLAAMGLYEESVEEQYNESMQATRQDFAVRLLHRYACLELGKLPEQYLNDYRGTDWMYNIFQYGTYYYTIRNEHGQAVESTMQDAPEGGTTYEMVVTKLRYRALVDILVETPEGLVPSEGTEPSEPPATSEPADETPAPTLDTTTRDTSEETSATIPNSVQREAEIIQDAYFDYEQEKTVYLTFLYRELPPYTVELYLLPNAAPEEYAWTLLRTVWVARNQLFWVLGISALSFAVFMVWLCVAAGRKKGTDEIKAGGLNCIPLDLYLVGVGFLVCFAVAVGAEALYFLMREMPKILIPVAILGGFVVCLIIVAFFFACAAQFKMKDGYWYRNTLCGWFFRFCYVFGQWLERFLGQKVFPLLGKLLRKLWQLLVLFWQFFYKACVWVYVSAEKGLGWLFATLGRFFRWMGAKLTAFFGLLPLMWQWLVAGTVMLIAVTFALLTRSEGLLVLSLCASFALVLYGATSFGHLLDGAKRMGKGDLETKVSDKHMVGAFKEFAGDLNALADVAVVAARNQLKSERMKTELITNVSHDIKTPLTSIINYVDLLQKPHTEEEQEVYLEVLSRQSGQLKKLIEDLMEMSKASTGNMAVDIMAVNAVEAVNQALGEFADKFERIQLTPVFRQPEEPVYMKADGRLAWRVLSNLLSNAYKYALPGTRLYIDLMELEGKVLISLKNISREELNVSADELLERFVRGDASRNTEGSGLGLNIAQSLMELQKGQLQLLVDGDLFKVTLVFPAARIE